MTISLLLEKKIILNLPNFQLLLLQVILQVSSVLSFHTLQILWLVNFIAKEKVKDQLDQKLLQSTNKLDSKGFGLVLLQESS
jgi:hypothetical protein